MKTRIKWTLTNGREIVVDSDEHSWAVFKDFASSKGLKTNGVIILNDEIIINPEQIVTVEKV